MRFATQLCINGLDVADGEAYVDTDRNVVGFLTPSLPNDGICYMLYDLVEYEILDSVVNATTGHYIATEWPK